MRTSATTTVPVAGTAGYVTLGPFQHGTLLQLVSLFAADPPADLTVRVGLFDRPPLTSSEFSSGEQLCYPLTVPSGVGFFSLPLSVNLRLLSKRYVSVEYSFAAGLSAAWVGGLNLGLLTPIVQRILSGSAAAVADATMSRARPDQTGF